MKREKIDQPTVKGYQRNKDESWTYFVCQNPKIAYVRISQFDDNTFDELKDALAGPDGQGGLLAQGMRGLILDLRFNPGGQLQQAIKVVNLFVKQGVIVSTHGRNSPEEIDRADGKDTLGNFPMIVLVNDQSASAAEIVAGSLQDNHRAQVLGQRTFGKGSVQHVIPLGEGDGTLKLTVAHWYLPSGRLLSHKTDDSAVGIDPQIVLPLDEAQEKAILDLMDRREAIRYHRPSTQPATMPTDPQFQQALTTMVGLIVLDANQQATTLPSTLPTTTPAPQPMAQ
jgi:carboxyl-terminal processing protease